jgi:hypothetical protein
MNHGAYPTPLLLFCRYSGNSFTLKFSHLRVSLFWNHNSRFSIGFYFWVYFCMEAAALQNRLIIHVFDFCYLSFFLVQKCEDIKATCFPWSNRNVISIQNRGLHSLRPSNQWNQYPINAKHCSVDFKENFSKIKDLFLIISSRGSFSMAFLWYFVLYINVFI